MRLVIAVLLLLLVLLLLVATTPDKAGATLSFGPARTLINTLSGPWSLALDPATRKLFVGDYSANVIYRYPFPVNTSVKAEATFGQGFSCSATAVDDNYQITFDPTSGTLYVADTFHSRILGLQEATTSAFDTADFVIGQENLTTCQSGPLYDIYGAVLGNNILWVATDVSAAFLKGYKGASNLKGILPAPFAQSPPGNYFGYLLSYDSVTDSLYVPSETSVFRFDEVSKGLSGSPSVVFGDGLFKSALNCIVDDVGNLYVSDYNGNRVLVYLNARDIVTDVIYADFVLGQANFTTTGAGELNGPGQLVWDSAQSQLIVPNYGAGTVVAYTVYGLPSSSPSTSPSSTPQPQTNEALRMCSMLTSILPFRQTTDLTLFFLLSLL